MTYPVEDHLQILNLIGRYSFALDERRQADLVDCFHPDAEIRFCENLLTPAEFAAATAELLTGVKGVHQAGNHVIEITGDHATATSYVHAVHIIPANHDGAEVIFGKVHSPTDSLIIGRYDDAFEKRDGQWKFSRRNINFLWQQHLPTMTALAGWQQI